MWPYALLIKKNDLQQGNGREPAQKDKLALQFTDYCQYRLLKRRVVHNADAECVQQKEEERILASTALLAKTGLLYVL